MLCSEVPLWQSTGWPLQCSHQTQVFHSWRCSITNKTELGKAGGGKGQVLDTQMRTGSIHCPSLLRPQQVGDTVPRNRHTLEVRAAIPRALKAEK